MRLDAYLDQRLVQTFLLSIAMIITFRQPRQGLYLSEPGSYLMKQAQTPAGTKRLSNLLHSKKWEKKLIERYLWEQADKKVADLEREGKYVLCVGWERD